jgi:hypothetical protein
MFTAIDVPPLGSMPALNDWSTHPTSSQLPCQGARSRFGGPFDRFNHRAFADGTEQRVTGFNLLRGDPAPPNDPEWMLWCRSDDPPADMKFQEGRVILEQVRDPFRDERAFGVILVPGEHEVSYADVFDELRSIGRQQRRSGGEARRVLYLAHVAYDTEQAAADLERVADRQAVLPNFSDALADVNGVVDRVQARQHFPGCAPPKPFATFVTAPGPSVLINTVAPNLADPAAAS